MKKNVFAFRIETYNLDVVKALADLEDKTLSEVIRELIEKQKENPMIQRKIMEIQNREFVKNE